MIKLPTGLKNYSTVADNIRDNIYIIGGNIKQGDTDKIYILDVIGNELIKSNVSLIYPRCNAQSVILNNVIYIMGGENHKGSVNSIEAIEIIDKYTLNNSRIV